MERSKYCLERLLDSPQDLVIRPGLILATEAGLFHRLTQSIRRTRVEPLFWGGDQTIQTVHIDDLCQAFDSAVTRDFAGRLNIAEQPGLSMRAFLRLMANRLGRRCLFVPLPASPVVSTLRLLEQAGARLPLSSENILGLKNMRPVSTARDLERLKLKVRSAEESLVDLLPGETAFATARRQVG